MSGENYSREILSVQYALGDLKDITRQNLEQTEKIEKVLNEIKDLLTILVTKQLPLIEKEEINVERNS